MLGFRCLVFIVCMSLKSQRCKAGVGPLLVTTIESVVVVGKILIDGGQSKTPRRRFLYLCSAGLLGTYVRPDNVRADGAIVQPM